MQKRYLLIIKFYIFKQPLILFVNKFLETLEYTKVAKKS